MDERQRIAAASGEAEVEPGTALTAARLTLYERDFRRICGEAPAFERILREAMAERFGAKRQRLTPRSPPAVSPGSGTCRRR